MVEVAQIITKLQNKIFTPYGKSVTLKHAASSNVHTYNDRGDITAYSWTTSTISAILYDWSTGRLDFQSMSSWNGGEINLAIPYDVVVSVQDQVVIDNVSYEVKEVFPNFLPTNAVSVIRLTKIVA